MLTKSKLNWKAT